MFIQNHSHLSKKHPATLQLMHESRMLFLNKYPPMLIPRCLVIQLSALKQHGVNEFNTGKRRCGGSDVNSIPTQCLTRHAKTRRLSQIRDRRQGVISQHALKMSKVGFWMNRSAKSSIFQYFHNIYRETVLKGVIVSILMQAPN